MKDASTTRRFRGLTTLSSLAVLLGVLVLLALSLANERRNAGEHARREVENTSRLLEAHALATVHKIDLLLREVQRNVRPADMRTARGVDGTRQRELHAVLASQAASVPEVAVLQVTDALGNHAYSSLDPVPRINIADRDHFIRHRTDAGAGLVISPPIVSRTTGKWTLVLSRRLVFEDGSFAGIINAVLNLDHFQHFYRNIDMGSRGLVALYDAELRLAARYPAAEKDMGRKVGLSARPLVEQGLRQGIYSAASALDGVVRLHAFRQVGDLPLLVFAALAEDDYLAEWRRHAWQYGLGALLFTCVGIVLWWRQRQAAEKLFTASLYARSLIEASLDPLVTIRADGKIMDVNMATEKVTGQPRDRLIGSDFSEYFTEPDKARAGYELVFSRGQVTDYPLAIRHASGRITDVLYNAGIYHDAQGNVAGVFAAARDITERKRMEAELKRSNADLEQFAYAISHDMRQPLRMVSSYLQLIEKALRDRLDDETREYLAFAKDGAQRMDGMIKALLDFSRVGRKADPMAQQEIRAALDEAMAFLGPEIAAGGGQVQVSGDWPLLVASRDEMVRLFQNLVGNALKYHEEGQAPRVEVVGRRLEKVWRCEIRDQGVGIDPAQFDRLFKVFSRLQARTRFDGAGVGLALCRKIVEHHGGDIGVESPGEGRGSTFWIELPLDAAPPQNGTTTP